MRDEAGAAAVRELLQVDSALDDDNAGRFAQDLLSLLVKLTEAGAGRIEVDRADGQGPVTLAAAGADIPGLGIRLTLPVSRPWSGEIILASEGGAWGRTLAELAAERLGLSLENERLRETDMRRQMWLTFLAEVSELLAQSLDVRLTMALIPRLVVPRLGEWCAVYVLPASSEDDLQLTAAVHSEESMLPQLLELLKGDISRTVFNRWQDALRAGTSTALAAPLDGYAIPLIARGQRLGTLAIGREPGQRRDPDEMAIAEDVARRAALALDNARTHEERRRVAQTLQKALLPPALPEIAGLGLGAEYVPAADGVDVGGDFYDVTTMPDGRCLLLIGDVSGKGIQAATVTGMVRDVLRVLVRDGRSLPAALATLNDTLFERRERHCTMALAAVGPGATMKEVEVSLFLAGHDRPLLVRADGTVTTAGAWGTALGLLHQVTCPEATVTLYPGDALVFFTDGVTDRRKGDEFFGMDRFKATAAQLVGYPAEVVAARLRAAALDFSDEPQRDDMAIMVLRNEAPD